MSVRVRPPAPINTANAVTQQTHRMKALCSRGAACLLSSKRPFGGLGREAVVVSGDLEIPRAGRRDVEMIKKGLRQAYRGHFERDFEALLLAHGWPWVEEGKQALLEFVSD